MKTIVRNNLRFILRTRHSALAQCAAVLALLGFAVYAILFTTIPTLHDFFHQFRHAMAIVPCH